MCCVYAIHALERFQVLHLQGDLTCFADAAHLHGNRGEIREAGTPVYRTGVPTSLTPATDFVTKLPALQGNRKQEIGIKHSQQSLPYVASMNKQKRNFTPVWSQQCV